MKPVVVDSLSLGYTRIDANTILYIAQNMHIKKNLGIYMGSSEREGTGTVTRGSLDPGQSITLNLFREYCNKRPPRSTTHVYLVHEGQEVKFGLWTYRMT